jgi:hypothetical protein
VIADTHIGLRGGQNEQALATHARQRVIEQLRVQPRHVPQMIQLHLLYFALSPAIKAVNDGESAFISATRSLTLSISILASHPLP